MKRALVLGVVAVLALAFCAFSEVLTGTWTFDVELDTLALAATPADFFDFSSTLLVSYEIDNWEFSSNSTINDTGWVDQSFSLDGTLGTFAIDSRLDITTGGVFEKLDFNVSFPFAALGLDIGIELKDKDLELVLNAQGSTDLIDLEVEIAFGGDDNDVCDLNWAGVDVDIEFPFCCGEIDAAIEITCDGFEGACFAVSGITVPNLPWVSFGARACFDLESKSLTLTPAFYFGVDVCFDLYITQIQNGGAGPGSVLTLGNYVISGISVDCVIGGDVSFTGQSYFGAGAKPSLLSGTAYWEAYKIATTAGGDCCGPLAFDAAVFFDNTSGSLFDVAGFEVNFSYDVGESLTISMGYDYSTVAPGLTLWTIGFVVEW